MLVTFSDLLNSLDDPRKTLPVWRPPVVLVVSRESRAPSYMNKQLIYPFLVALLCVVYQGKRRNYSSRWHREENTCIVLGFERCNSKRSPSSRRQVRLSRTCPSCCLGFRLSRLTHACDRETTSKVHRINGVVVTSGSENIDEVRKNCSNQVSV